jgi:hypothetical protein
MLIPQKTCAFEHLLSSGKKQKNFKAGMWKKEFDQRYYCNIVLLHSKYYAPKNYIST